MPNSCSALERDITEQSVSTWTDCSVCEGMGLPRSVAEVPEQKLNSPEWLVLIITVFYRFAKSLCGSISKQVFTS